MTNLLFAYGLLMTGQSGSADLELYDKLTWIGRDSVTGRLYDCGGYPGLVPGEYGDVAGEVFRVRDEAVWHTLDRFEDYDPAQTKNSLYIRKRAVTASGYDVWLYCFNGATASLSLVPQSDWRHIDSRKGKGSPGRHA